MNNINSNNPGKDSLKLSRLQKLTIAAVVSVFSVLIFLITSLRYTGLLDLNWDMGINMQLLWTNTHGYLLFETADFETSGIRSFLQINSAYVAIPLSYLYRLFPTAYTLLCIQSIGISLSAVPIFYYARARTQNPNLSLLIAIFFLSGFAVLSGVFYDFHWESFIPLEFFAFVYLVYRRHYLLGALIIVIGTLTLEVFPFFAASYLLYMLFFTKDASEPGYYSSATRWRERIVFLSLLLFSGVAYYSAMYIGGVVIPGIVGSQTTAVSSTHSVSYLFNFGVTPANLLNSSDYWLLLLTSMGFIPLLKPKSLIVILPWLYWSSIAFPQYYTTQFGVQYGILATSVLLVPFIEGISYISNKQDNDDPNVLYTLLGPASILVIGSVIFHYSTFVNHAYLLPLIVVFGIIGIATIAMVTLDLESLNAMKKKFSKSPLSRKSVYVFLVVAIMAGIVIGPLNPLNTQPEGTGGYSVAFSPNPSFEYMGQITTIVGHNSTVLTTDNLFVFVANNPNAYSLFWYAKNYSSDHYFPYSENNMPKYILLDTSMMFTVPHSYINTVFNTTKYGLRVEIQNSNYPGNVYLFELGYQGKSLVDKSIN